jgi:hypothetical protein
MGEFAVRNQRRVRTVLEREPAARIRVNFVARNDVRMQCGSPFPTSRSSASSAGNGYVGHGRRAGGQPSTPQRRRPSARRVRRRATGTRQSRSHVGCRVASGTRLPKATRRSEGRRLTRPRAATRKRRNPRRTRGHPSSPATSETPCAILTRGSTVSWASVRECPPTRDGPAVPGLSAARPTPCLQRHPSSRARWRSSLRSPLRSRPISRPSSSGEADPRTRDSPSAPGTSRTS